MVGTDVPGLWVLPAGERTGRDSEYLASQRTQQVLDKLTRGARNRIVIFDSPPAWPRRPRPNLPSTPGRRCSWRAATMTGRAALEDAVDLLSACPDIACCSTMRLSAPAGAASAPITDMGSRPMTKPYIPTRQPARYGARSGQAGHPRSKAAMPVPIGRRGEPSSAGSRGRARIDPYIEANTIASWQISPGSDVVTYTQLAAGVDASVAGRNNGGSRVGALRAQFRAPVRCRGFGHHHRHRSRLRLDRAECPDGRGGALASGPASTRRAAR